NLAAQVVAYIFGSIISLQAVFGLGKRVIRFVSVISGMIAVGMVLAIALMSISK
ncbi:hypothetical protein HGB24_03650, partial [Candidatus Saccharibacteria bacterium]|nr:hypothetical protein [Candidatus Saccharibacteria bacterium]